MNEHVTPWLGAYHDGELHGRRLHQVEEHLALCATCRAELAEIQTLSVLLRESPSARTLTPPEQFVAQVGLRLPRRPQPPAWSQMLRTGWKLAPLGLVGAWAFAQAVFVVAGALLLLLRLGVGGDVVSGLLPGLQQGGWWNELLDLSSAGLSDVLRVGGHMLSGGGPLGWGIVLYLAVLFVLGVLYWSWMASWWARRRRHQRV